MKSTRVMLSAAALLLAMAACSRDDPAKVDACAGVACSGKGLCVVLNAAPICVCDAGYSNDGPTACVPGGSNTGSCASSADCPDSAPHCVDNVCCIEVCDSACMACANSATGTANGTCAPVLIGLDPTEDCAGVPACDGSGTCFAGALAAACIHDYQCANGHCADGVCCDVSCSGTCEVCDGNDTAGAAGTCSPVDAGADPADDCSGSLACNGSGGCYARADGQLCDALHECVSGACVDGVCCNDACDASCFACNATLTGATDGVCSAVSAGLDPHSDCVGLGCSGSATFGCRLADWSVCSNDWECATGSCLNGLCRNITLETVLAAAPPHEIFYDNGTYYAYSGLPTSNSGCVPGNRKAIYLQNASSAVSFLNIQLAHIYVGPTCSSYDSRDPRMLWNGSEWILYHTDYYQFISSNWAFFISRFDGMVDPLTWGTDQITMTGTNSNVCGDWQAWHTGLTDILFDGTRYVMWFSAKYKDGCVTPPGEYTMGVATSSDGATFSGRQRIRDETTAYIDDAHPDYANFRVSWDGVEYTMVYALAEGLYSRTSIDGISWQARTQLLSLDAITTLTGNAGTLALHTLFKDIDDETYIYFGVDTFNYRVSLSSLLPP